MFAMFIEQKKIRKDLKVFLLIIMALIVIGLLFIYSASSVYALEKFGNASYFVKKQCLGLVLGLIGLIFFYYIPLNIIKNSSPLIFIVAYLTTGLTLFSSLSTQIHGSNRWLYIKGLSIQPSELLKIATILYISYFLTQKKTQLLSFKHGYIPFITILGAIALLLLKQPDFGMMITIVMTAFILFFIIQIKTKHLLLSIAALIPIITGLIYLRPYRWKRILTFLNPWNDPQGAGFQIIQSLIAIGSGGLTGLGISNSKQKFFYLPMQHTDFIFSIIAEETGFIGSCILISLYVLFLYYGMRIAWYLKDNFAALVTMGFVIMTTMQTTINLAVVTGLVPTKGIGLPFISYGNSALISSLCMVGIIINCVYNNRENI